MQIEKLRITEPIAKALIIALNQPTAKYCIHKNQLHGNTLNFLLQNDLLETTNSVGCWRFNEMFILTEKGKQIAIKVFNG